ARMDAAVVGHPYAKAAVEIALWDLLGRACGHPLHVLLGGGGDGDLRTPVKYVIGIGDEARLREEGEDGRELGFRQFKTKVGMALRDDLARVEVLRGALREGETLGVDANAGWSPVVALQALAPLEALGVSFLEQPVSPALPEAMAALTARSTIPI